MTDTVHPIPGPYYVVEAVRNPKKPAPTWTVVRDDYVRIEGRDITPDITVCRRWGNGVEPGSSIGWGSGDGIHVASFKPTHGPEGRAQALANALALVRASRLDGFTDGIDLAGLIPEAAEAD